jgi:MSHA biogenesis protein MshL
MNLYGWSRTLRVTPLWALVGAACAGSPAVVPQTHVRLDAPPPAVASAPAELPSLPPMSTGSSIADAHGPRLKELNAPDQELSVVVRALATQFGLQYQIDPSVRGRVNTTLRNKTLNEALDAIMPQGVTYQIQNGVLRVGPARLETRTFSMDYVALARIGTASTVIQRRLSSSGLSGATGTGNAAGGSQGAGTSGGLGGGADVISASSVADVWEDIRVAVEALTFDAPTAEQQSSVAAATAGGGGMSGGRPWSRTTPDGRRVIVNSIAGQITVTAMPARLDQIEQFIKAFESSIQRQVLIEAKIVEVSLEKSSEFGIDWNSVATNNKASFSPGSARGGSTVELTFTGGGAKISAVLTALASQGNVRVLSSPRVSALNNQRAVFDVTTGEIVFSQSRQLAAVTPGAAPTFTTTVTPTQVNVGIVLDVLAQISANNTVTMNIRPVVTSVARVASFTSAEGSSFQAPVIDTRETDTMARLRDGETIIIGGLMQNRHEKVKSGVPILRSIPLLGRLFTRTIEVERKAELVIFLTPTIIAGPPPAAR